MNMGDIARKPDNALTCMRWAATRLLAAYKVMQTEEDKTKAETLILEAIDVAQHAVKLLRREKR